jgi:hypothetical protein
MITIYRTSQVAIALGVLTLFYGTTQHDVTLIILGIAVTWCGFGLFNTFLEIQRSHED